MTHMPGGYKSPRDADLQALQSHGIDLLICLVEDWELGHLEPPETLQERRQATQNHAMDFFHHPIEDFAAPDLQAAYHTIEHIHKCLTEGKTIIMHCWAGLGRAGTMAACLLVHRGMTAQDAIHTVRWVRPGAIQSQSQEALIAAFAATQNPL